jgi:hypothetical protein
MVGENGGQVALVYGGGPALDQISNTVVVSHGGLHRSLDVRDGSRR